MSVDDGKTAPSDLASSDMTSNDVTSDDSALNDEVPRSHPRYVSLMLREAIVAGVDAGVTSVHGLIAHGRGEALDYLLGERTHDFAQAAARAGAAMLLAAERPVVSVNGNAAALVPEGLIDLGRVLGAPLEVNIFHASAEREAAISGFLRQRGADQVLMPTQEAQLDYIESNRRFVHPDGILRADVVFVPLEDGDRCQALRRMGKEVITVDLNPLSRTARKASVTLVDNVVRALPALQAEIEALKNQGAAVWRREIDAYDHGQSLALAENTLRTGKA
jgi:4-phosphopantoate---beta-alanine ligase